MVSTRRSVVAQFSGYDSKLYEDATCTQLISRFPIYCEALPHKPAREEAVTSPKDALSEIAQHASDVRSVLRCPANSVARITIALLDPVQHRMQVVVLGLQPV